MTTAINRGCYPPPPTLTLFRSRPVCRPAQTSLYQPTSPLRRLGGSLPATTQGLITARRLVKAHYNISGASTGGRKQSRLRFIAERRYCGWLLRVVRGFHQRVSCVPSSWLRSYDFLQKRILSRHLTSHVPMPRHLRGSTEVLESPVHIHQSCKNWSMDNNWFRHYTSGGKYFRNVIAWMLNIFNSDKRWFAHLLCVCSWCCHVTVCFWGSADTHYQMPSFISWMAAVHYKKQNTQIYK